MNVIQRVSTAECGRYASGILAAFFVVLLAGCVTAKPSQDIRPVSAEVQILKLSRNETSPFRFSGEVRVLAPKQYRDKRVPCFLLSQERDLTAFVDQIVTIHTTVQRLYYDLEFIDPFTVGDAPRLNAEFREGQFQGFDEARYARELEVTARIVRYDAAGDDTPIFFVYDMLVGGDLVTVEVESPAIYRGTRLRVLIENPKIVSPLWVRIGAQVTFTVPESTLAWEPWGFSFVRDLKDLAITEKPGGQR